MRTKSFLFLFFLTIGLISIAIITFFVLRSNLDTEARTGNKIQSNQIGAGHVTKTVNPTYNLELQ